jgi:NAD(P)-dependent dehydrogenase (short-subunit alcohol dehydrogenase family)
MSADPLFSVAGRVAVVTGGLGQLGRQFSGALAARGAHVAILDRRQDPALVATRFGDLPGRVISLEADITRRAELEAALAIIETQLGTPHILINNAALDSPPNAPAAENGPFEHYPEESWDRVMEVNVKGVFLTCQVIGGRMAEAGRGSVINVSSIYGLVSPDQRIYSYRAASGAPFYKPVAYAASKSALLNLTRYLATYWAPRGVRVNTVTFAGVFNHQDEQFLAGYLPKVPLGRMAREDEYNGAIVFLASDASAYMTGANLVIDGGWTAW